MIHTSVARLQGRWLRISKYSHLWKGFSAPPPPSKKLDVWRQTFLFERKDKAEVNFICMSQYRISFWKYCQATFLMPGKVTHSESSQERKLNRIKNGTGWGLKQEKEVRERKLDCLKWPEVANSIMRWFFKKYTCKIHLYTCKKNTDTFMHT